MENQKDQLEKERVAPATDAIMITQGQPSQPFYICPICGGGMDVNVGGNEFLLTDPKGFWSPEGMWICGVCGEHPDEIPEQLRNHALNLLRAAERQYVRSPAQSPATNRLST
jgi:hypothetical protein